MKKKIKFFFFFFMFTFLGKKYIIKLKDKVREDSNGNNQMQNSILKIESKKHSLNEEGNEKNV